ncbi:MAG TPA: hypothetical protein VFR11_00670 [Micromonosporaceae bacterium]|nr:hypothetical protein [Micromonosporaceae bacterium]
MRRAWRLWRAHLAAFVPIAVAIVAPLLILAELLDEWVGTSTVTAVAIASVFGVAAAAFGEALCAGIAEDILHHGAAEGPRHERLSLWATVRRLPVIRLTVLAVIIGVSVAIGVLLLLLPGLAVFAWLSLACTVALVEGRGVRDSLRASVSLVRGHFWKVAALTTTALVPSAVADQIAEALHGAHPPMWIEIVVDAILDTVAISLTAAIIVVLYGALSALHIDDARAGR